jgi:hypothetical protein
MITEPRRFVWPRSGFLFGTGCQLPVTGLLFETDPWAHGSSFSQNMLAAQRETGNPKPVTGKYNRQ